MGTGRGLRDEDRIGVGRRLDKIMRAHISHGLRSGIDLGVKFPFEPVDVQGRISFKPLSRPVNWTYRRRT